MAVTLLPLEIHGQIAMHVKLKRDLVSYLTASRAILGEVERELYRDIHLTGYDAVALDELLDALLIHPHRCSLVRQFVIGFETRPSTSHIRKLESTFKLMINLLYLHLGIKGLYISEIITGCAFQLERFSASGQGQDPALASFLTSQPSLRRIDIPRILSIDRLPSASLPSLSILTGTASVINMLLPGRFIERLYWASEINPARFESISTAGSDPQFLSLRVLKASGALRQLNIPQTCPNLRVLEFPGPVMFFRPHELNCLIGLEHLHTIRALNPSNRGEQKGEDSNRVMSVWNSGAYRQIVDNAFERINSLQVFQFQYGARERRRGDSRLRPIREWIPWYECV